DDREDDVKGERDAHLGAGGEQVGHRDEKLGEVGKVRGGWGRLNRHGTTSPNLPSQGRLHLTTVSLRGDLRRIAATLNNSLKSLARCRFPAATGVLCLFV